jgi:hypothetical protein
MMKVVFVANEFELRTPVQQLLDRFLIGYPYEGKFHQAECEVVLAVPKKNDHVERRIKEFALRWQPATDRADAAVIFQPRSDERSYLGRCFVYGNSSRCISGTAIRAAWLLPELAVPNDARLAKGLLIVQGAYPAAELDALNALLPLIWSHCVPKIRSVIRLTANDFWAVLKRDFWPLVKSAISRSDSPQGDAVRDGRTQDLVGLALLEKLVKAPRGWLVELADGLQFVIAVMDGGVADYNVAVQTRAGGIISAQVYRPPVPAEHHYSRLAAMLERYFRNGIPPWPIEQNLLTAEVLQRFDALR